MTAKFEIEKELAKIGDFFNGEKSLTVTSWYGKPAKMDIRSWAKNKDGEVFPKGGITLTNDEAMRLLLALCRHFGFTPLPPCTRKAFGMRYRGRNDLK